MSIEWTSDVPIEWSIDMPTEWWIELRIEVPSEVPIELPSPESSAGSGCEWGRERVGKWMAAAGCNRGGPSGLRRFRNR
ncbi:MAG: hypothetical protein NTX53_17545 [candidate division WOR-3 bacterium]|nr:hypothetical protein [candidate division WOR-3 bacterium]